MVALAALLAKNIVRTRPGRAMQAIRDRDVAAEVIGVSLARYKVGAFAVSSALAAVAGGLLGGYQRVRRARSEWTLFLSIQFVAIIIVGGLGTIFGSILGRPVRRLAPTDHRGVLATRCRIVSADSGGDPVHQRVRAQPGALRAADRGVPGARATRAGGPVAAGQDYFGLAVLVLSDDQAWIDNPTEG